MWRNLRDVSKMKIANSLAKINPCGKIVDKKCGKIVDKNESVWILKFEIEKCLCGGNVLVERCERVQT